MSRQKRSIFVDFTFAMLFAAVFLAGSLAQAVTIHEYVTPTPDSSPAGLAFDGEGNLWFTEINGNKIGKIDPAEAKPGTSQGVVEFDLPNANSQPNGIIVAQNGMVWFSEMSGNRIGRLDPATGKIKEYAIPTPKSEPHKLVEGPKGGIWFAEFEADKIARLDPVTGTFEEYQVNPGHPHDLVIRDQQVWYSQGGKFWARIFFNKMASLDIKTREVQEIVIPPENSVPHGVTLDAAGNIWFTQFFAHKISRLEPSAAPKIVDYPIPGKRKGPHDLAVDDKKGWVWFVLNHADSIGRLDLSRAKPGTGQGIEEFKIPTKGSHPNSLALDREGNVWFTEMGHFFRGQYHNKIGKLIP
ncbi:MAG: virginiamycin B lyase [Nitrospinaceae bacterium]|nr:MAG: virginiamycin B lyase [Nitrospinaceae bacterium]